MGALDVEYEDEDAIDAIAGGRPRLVELARNATRTQSVWWWSTMRVGAVVRANDVRIERRCGHVSGINRLRLDASQLRTVVRACSAWLRVRERFAAFYSSSAGYPGGYGGAEYYQPPGSAEVVCVGSTMLGRRTGQRLVGRDDVIRVDVSQPIAPGIVAVASTWRRGEKHGPKAGSLVGARWRVGDVRIDVGREEATIACGRGRVVIEHDEIAFVRALVRVLGATPAAARRQGRGA